MKGNIIKAKIIEKGYTNKDMAKILNINEQTLSNWINNRNVIQIEKFLELCKILDIDINLL